ncbi:hypothetical protein NHH88_23855 [Oxalobacteraceae bacterium OTU3CAMAD1]|nr:hypothetical protein NHH88_23855 [Oxalobacteraceae bacterium OTU3CAMAD1]
MRNNGIVRQVLNGTSSLTPDLLARPPLVGDDEFAERAAVEVDDLATGFAEAQADRLVADFYRRAGTACVADRPMVGFFVRGANIKIITIW